MGACQILRAAHSLAHSKSSLRHPPGRKHSVYSGCAAIPVVHVQVALLRGRKALPGKLVMLVQALTAPTMAGPAAGDQLMAASQGPLDGQGISIPTSIQVCCIALMHWCTLPLVLSWLYSRMTCPQKFMMTYMADSPPDRCKASPALDSQGVGLQYPIQLLPVTGFQDLRCSNTLGHSEILSY